MVSCRLFFCRILAPGTANAPAIRPGRSLMLLG